MHVVLNAISKLYCTNTDMILIHKTLPIKIFRIANLIISAPLLVRFKLSYTNISGIEIYRFEFNGFSMCQILSHDKCNIEVKTCGLGIHISCYKGTRRAAMTS